MLTILFTFFTRVFQAFLAVLLLALIVIGMLATYSIYIAETTDYAQYRPQVEAECANAVDVPLCVSETLADMSSVKLILGLGASAGIIATIILVIWIRNWMRKDNRRIQANKEDYQRNRNTHKRNPDTKTHENTPLN